MLSPATGTVNFCAASDTGRSPMRETRTWYCALPGRRETSAEILDSKSQIGHASGVSDQPTISGLFGDLSG
jgi:hypothetical protein